jgi:hypothetical protein
MFANTNAGDADVCSFVCTLALRQKKKKLKLTQALCFDVGGGIQHLNDSASVVLLLVLRNATMMVLSRDNDTVQQRGANENPTCKIECAAWRVARLQNATTAQKINKTETNLSLRIFSHSGGRF